MSKKKKPQNKVLNTQKVETPKEKTAEKPQVTKQKKNGKFKNFMTAKNPGMLALRIVILLAIPYAYLMLCGFFFENVLHLYTSFSYMFTFISLCVLAVVNLTLIILCIVWYVQSKKGNKKSK